jgi:poly-gamma-glutamate capsule biosynthesis protein CapA/YwtB (metallophosphatase superfamily)
VNKVFFLGDTMLGRETPSLFNSNILAEDVKEKLLGTDYRIANLEAPIKDNDLNYSRFHVNSSELEKVKFIDAFSLANNHIFDQGMNGFISTIDALQNKSVKHFGTFENPKLSIESEKGIIEIVACIDFEILKNKTSEEFKLYEENILSFNNADQLNEFFSSNSYKRVIYVHAGDEYIPIISNKLKLFFEEYRIKGIDAIIINHPHVSGSNYKLNSLEVYYSLGDFIFDGQSYQRQKSYGLIFDSINSSFETIFFKRDDKNGLVTIDNRKIRSIEYNLLSRINSLVCDWNYKILFWLYMIYYQSTRVVFLIQKKGFKKTLEETFSRLKLIKKFI